MDQKDDTDNAMMRRHLSENLYKMLEEAELCYVTIHADMENCEVGDLVRYNKLFEEGAKLGTEINGLKIERAKLLDKQM